MLLSKNWLNISLLASFCLFLSDQLAKWLILARPTFSFYLIEPWLGCELFKNPGVAFGLPLPNWLLVFSTPLLLLFLILYALKKYQHPKTLHLELFGYILIIAGALSNYFDRVIYGITIDYIRILYSVINLADITIIVGLFFVFKTNQTHIDKA